MTDEYEEARKIRKDFDQLAHETQQIILKEIRDSK